jgi:hypothetical protein
MRACCNGADFIIPGEGCAIYCKVTGQTDEQLMQCLSRLAGQAQGNTAGILCSSNAGATRGIEGLSKNIMVVMGLLVVVLAFESL